MDSVKSNFHGYCLVKNFKGFCNSTSLHGFNTLIMENITQKERLLWSAILILMLILTVILLSIAWTWDEENIVATVIESTSYPSYSVPFPAVTFCNFNKISKEASYNLAEKLKKPKNISVDEVAKLFRLLLHFSGGIKLAEPEKYRQFDEIIEMNNLTTESLHTKIAPKCSDMLLKCMWKGTVTKCDVLFQPIRSTLGICCAFNYFATEKSNFPEKLTYATAKVPHRIAACGYQTGLSVLMTPRIDDYFATLLNSVAFRIYVHNPYDFPDENAEIRVASVRTENFVSLQPEMTYSTKSVRQLTPDQRQCYFPDERKLGAMRQYSFRNCMGECRSLVSYELCGCVPPFYANNESIPQCNMSQLRCTLEKIKLIVGAVPGLNISSMAEYNPAKIPCDCRMDCDTNEYLAEITSAELKDIYSFNMFDYFKPQKITDEILVHVFFNDLVLTRFRRDISQNWLELLATFGGIFGIMMGFSLVTGIEFIYFFTIRPIFDRFAN